MSAWTLSGVSTSLWMKSSTAASSFSTRTVSPVQRALFSARVRQV